MPDGYNSAETSIAQEVFAGLTQAQKTLPAKLFYDPEGCRLFGEITRLPEYYVTRAELALLAEVAPQLPHLPGCALIEYGASDEAKAMSLIGPIGAASYVPIDIAAEALQEVAARLRRSQPTLAVHPVAADFLRPVMLPDAIAACQKFGFFPGSTIGNLDHEAACSFLRQARETLGAGSYFLVGVDLRKDPAILIPAYDDAQGVTAAFNRNLLAHVNREIGTDFDLASFEHRAIWNDAASRIEMHLVSTRQQTIDLDGATIAFAPGESIHTENSYKHTVPQFQALAARAGWDAEQVWTDAGDLFSIHLLRGGRHVQ